MLILTQSQSQLDRLQVSSTYKSELQQLKNDTETYTVVYTYKRLGATA